MLYNGQIKLARYIYLTYKGVQNCFTKIFACQDDAGMDIKQLAKEFQASFHQLGISNIKAVIKLEEFLNFAKEKVTHNSESLNSISQFKAKKLMIMMEFIMYLLEFSTNEALGCFL
jgi:hypothetical protein